MSSPHNLSLLLIGALLAALSAFEASTRQTPNHTDAAGMVTSNGHASASIEIKRD